MIPPTIGIGQVVLAILAAIGFGAGLWRLVHLYRLLRVGRADPERWGRLPRRILDEIVVYLGQRKLFKRPYSIRGIAHALIFWGFLVIVAATTELLVSGVSGGWHLPGATSGAFAWMLDVLSLLVIVAIAIAWARRSFFAPKHMHVAGQGYAILALIAVLIVALFAMEAGGVAAGRVEPGAAVPPIGAALGPIVPASLALPLFAVGFWGHLVSTFFFAAWLPRTKHLHVVTTLPNVFFRSQRPRGALRLRRQDRGAGDVRRGDPARSLVEAASRRLHLHRVRALLGQLPGARDRQAARPAEDRPRPSRPPVEGG